MRSGLVTLLVGSFALLATACGGALGDGSALSVESAANVPLSVADRAQVAAGNMVSRPLDFEQGGAHYVGGIASGPVPATPEEILAAMDDVSALAAMLPRTKRATLVGTEGDVRWVELKQGNSVIDATYTVELVRGGPGELRFTLDRSRPHGIDDVYGYFKVEKLDDKRSLVTVAAAVDVGSGIATMLFGSRVQSVILSAPVVMRDYFAHAPHLPSTFAVAQNDGR